VNGVLQVKTGTGTSAAWQTITSGPTDSHGTLTATVPLSSKSTFRFATDGSWAVAAGQSSDVTITPSRLLTWSAPTSMKVGTTYIVGGTISPATPGIRVHLLKGSSESDSTLTGADGSFSFTLEENKIGIVHYQAHLEADSLFAASSTPAFGTLIR